MTPNDSITIVRLTMGWVVHHTFTPDIVGAMQMTQSEACETLEKTRSLVDFILDGYVTRPPSEGKNAAGGESGG